MHSIEYITTTIDKSSIGSKYDYLKNFIFIIEKKPCVGVCQYYREHVCQLRPGCPNPYEWNYQK